MNQKIGFIGAGNMAGAIINGMLGQGNFSPKEIFIYDLDQNKCCQMARKGLSVCDNASEVVTKSHIVFLAVKPQNYKEVLLEIKPVITEETVFVTIAAGISIAFIREHLQRGCPVARAMPNTPLLLGKGATALCRSDGLSDEDFKLILSIFSSSGIVEVLPESQMNAVIAINGSSPAYIYLFAKAVMDYAKQEGIGEEAALHLICKTFEGSAAMLIGSGKTPDELIRMVSSPGGTTLKALEALEKNGFCSSLFLAMEACTKRAEELGQ